MALALVLLTWAGFSPGVVWGAQTNVSQVAPTSLFVMPANPVEGRDPFYPDSSRPYASVVAHITPSTDLSSLVVKGTSGTSQHRLVIINNITFGEGDDADVSTSRGHMRIRCLEINNDSVVIEVAGRRQVLHFKDK